MAKAKAARKTSSPEAKKKPAKSKPATKTKYVQKTQPNDDDVTAFVNGLDDAEKRSDALTLIELMQKASGERPRLWSGGMIGFGDHHYKYASGHEGDTFRIGFAPRKAAISLYLNACDIATEPLLATLGKYKTGKGCLYVKRLSDVDLAVLTAMIEKAAATRP